MEQAVQHERCRRCRRRLTTAESREKGIGPVCERKELAESALGAETEKRPE